MIELQDITFEIENLMAKRVDLPQAIHNLEEALEGIEGALRATEQRVETLKSDHRAKETALKQGVEQAKKAKGRLLEVKTNKEYEALLKEIDALHEKNGTIEDEIIRMLEEIDRADEILKEKEQETAKHRSTYETEIRQMEDELNSIDSELEKVLKKQDNVRGRTNENVLKKFDMIKNRKGGRAIVPVWKAVCSGCHMNIPPQMYNELQRNDNLMLCPHCERIIYWEDRDHDV